VSDGGPPAPGAGSGHTPQVAHHPAAIVFVLDDRFRGHAPPPQLFEDHRHGFRFQAGTVDGRAVEQVFGRRGPCVGPDAVQVELHPSSLLTHFRPAAKDREPTAGDFRPKVQAPSNGRPAVAFG